MEASISACKINAVLESCNWKKAASQQERLWHRLQNRNAHFSNRFHHLTCFPTQAIGPERAKNPNKPNSKHPDKWKRGREQSPQYHLPLQHPPPEKILPGGSWFYWRSESENPLFAPLQKHAPHPAPALTLLPPGVIVPRTQTCQWGCGNVPGVVHRHRDPPPTQVSSQIKGLYNAQSMDLFEVIYSLQTVVQGTVTSATRLKKYCFLLIHLLWRGFYNEFHYVHFLLKRLPAQQP